MAKLTYDEMIAKLKDQAVTLLDMCDADQTPTICEMLEVPGNKENLVNSIVELNKEGYTTLQAISMLEMQYNPNKMQD